MKVNVRTRGAIDIVSISGRPAADADAAALRERLVQLIDAGEILFVLDLSQVDGVDSCFLGELVADRERVRKHDGVIKLVLTEKLRDYFLLTGLDRLFEIYPDDEEALDSFVGENATAGIP